LKEDYKDDYQLSEDLEMSKRNLYLHFDANYASRHSASSSHTPVASSTLVTNSQVSPGSPQRDFMARYQRRETTVVNEIDEYFKMRPASLDTNPIHWWLGRRAQFPNLFCMARDILCIPGM
jgi:hypothetical protein